MKVKVLTLRWSDETGGLDDRELDAFLEGRAVLEVSEHFFIHDKQPTLVLTLSFRDEAPSNGGRGPRSGKPSRPDPRQGLDPVERARSTSSSSSSSLRKASRSASRWGLAGSSPVGTCDAPVLPCRGRRSSSRVQ